MEFLDVFVDSFRRFGRKLSGSGRSQALPRSRCRPWQLPRWATLKLSLKTFMSIALQFVEAKDRMSARDPA
jgi:hypothetical protein